MTKSELTLLVYFWTKDSKMEVNQGTEFLIIDALAPMLKKRKHNFSDVDRAVMAERIAETLLKKPERKKVERVQDPACEIFEKLFLEIRNVPYTWSSGDFINLAGLRKKLQYDGRAVPVGWERTCRSYFESEFVTKFTLAGLCSRYDVFLRGPLKRGGQQIQTNSSTEGQSGGDHGRTGRGERRFNPSGS